MAELTEVRTAQGSRRTIAVESEDATRVIAAVRELGLGSRRNVNMARGLKALVGFGSRRYAVIDVGTNSVKFHVGERAADGEWRTIVDRAEVTRLGEGLDEAGRLEPEPMERTIEAIAAMAEEARRERRRGDRSGRNRRVAPRVQQRELPRRRASSAPASRSRSSPARRRAASPTSPRRPGSESAAARSSCSTRAAAAPSSRSVTGNASTSGSASTSAPSASPSAMASTAAVSDETLAAALDAIAAELSRLDDRPSPDTLVGMGGTVTNLAAVKHGLATYDPDVVQGTVLDRAEVDRQIELYRTRTAERASADRRSSARTRRSHPRRRLHRPNRPRQARLRIAHRQRPRPAARSARRPLRIGMPRPRAWLPSLSGVSTAGAPPSDDWCRLPAGPVVACACRS